MPVARNMKELEKMIMEKMKKELPNATREYSRKWYAEHPEMHEIVSKEKFVEMVNDSFKVSVKNGQLNAEFGIFQKDDIPEKYVEQMKTLWEDFKTGYQKSVMSKIMK